MSGIRVFGRVIAVLIIIMFVLVTPVLLLAFNAQQAVIGGSFLEDLFQDTSFFEDALRAVARDLPRNLSQDARTVGTPIARLSNADWERILVVVAPPEMLQELAQDAVQSFRGWLDTGGVFMADVTVPFGEMLENIINDPQQTVLRTLTEAQPACGSGEAPFAGTLGLIPRCQPPAAELDQFYQTLTQRWSEQAPQVWQQLWPEEISEHPDDVPLSTFVHIETDLPSGEEQAGWRIARWGLLAAPWVLAALIFGWCVVLMGLVALLAARNWREAFHWIGTPLALTGLSTVLLGVVTLASWDIAAAWLPGEVSAPLVVASEASRVFASTVWPPMAWQGGVMLLVGLGLWLLSPFVPGRRPKSPRSYT